MAGETDARGGEARGRQTGGGTAGGDGHVVTDQAATAGSGASVPAARPVPDAVAVVGMACVLPGAPDVEAFWANVVDGVDSVTEVPPSRWRHELHFDADGDGPTTGGDARSVSKWGGFVPDIGFDALTWGIPPASLSSIDPAQLLALHCAGRALDDAGYGPDGRALDRERASVVYATGSGGAADVPAAAQFRLWLRNHGIRADDLPPELDAFLPPITADGLPGVLTSVIAGRVANRLDLGGKNLTVDSACASVLVALDIARGELLARSSDLVLCGGVDLHNGVQDFVSFTAAQALSPTGRCRSFDADADGMTLAEGAGCLVLKRLSDALADDDRIYAVVRGVAGSSDGRSLGLTAPRQEGQVRALRRAYATADLHPSQVRLVEAHGTGTPTGDRIELRSTTQVYTEAGVGPGSVVIGSVKSNIGHTKCASGMASLIKTAKALYHGVLPPTLHVEQPNGEWQPSSPFAFRDRAAPWLADERHAGVSSFGFGGTNFHALLSAPPPSARPGAEDVSGRPAWPAELFALRAATDDDLAVRLAELADRLAGELTTPRPADRWRLRDVAAAVSGEGGGAGGAGTTPVPVRLAIVAHDLDDLARKVDAARRGEPRPGVHRPGDGTTRLADRHAGSDGTIAADGARRVAALAAVADLVVAFPVLRSALPGDGDLVATLFPPQAFDDGTRARQRDAVTAVADTADAIAARVVTTALAHFGVSDHQGDTPVLCAGSPTMPGDPVHRTWGHGAGGDHRPGPRGAHGVVRLLHLLAQLAVDGEPVDLGALHRGRGSDPERWRDPPRRPGWLVDGHCARDAAGRPLPNGLRPADEAPTVRFATGQEAPAPPASSDGSPPSSPAELAPVLAYLTLVQQTIAAGTQIIRHELRTPTP
jgi:acyl transferase domain-containing protein